MSKPYELNRQTLYRYLEMGSLVNMVKQKSKGDTVFSKPEKLYLNNTNLNYAYCNKSEIGTTREQFFYKSSIIGV
ncbi:MAG: hypothetical protein JJW00_02345 [Sulfurimonas sp.]|nr:hypothetical protein [Sulfurimonas sp.]